MKGIKAEDEEPRKAIPLKMELSVRANCHDTEVPSRKVHSALFPHKRDASSERVTSQKQRLIQRVHGADASKGGKCVRHHQPMLTGSVFFLASPPSSTAADV
jgi:hypothetical protein